MCSVISANETGQLQTRVRQQYSSPLLYPDTPRKKFYHEYRKAVSYGQEDPNAPLPVFASLAEWERSKSTKLDVCVRICRHYLSRDDVLDVEFADGVVIFPELPPSEARKKFTNNRKILIYSESPNVTILIQNVSSRL
jgi:hypothetical protein